MLRRSLDPVSLEAHVVRKRARSGLAVAVAVLLTITLPDPAAADDEYFGSGPGPASGGTVPQPTAPQAPNTGAGAAAPSETAGSAPTALAGIQDGKECRRISKRRKKLCSYFRDAKLVKQRIRVLRGARRGQVTDRYIRNDEVRRVCRRRASSTRWDCWRPTGSLRIYPVSVAAPAAGRPVSEWTRFQVAVATSGLNSYGWTNPMAPQVGAVWANGQQICSGTLIARGIVLTAGHCLYKQGQGYNSNVWFLPQQSWVQGTLAVNPVGGQWKARDWWVPNGWANGDSGVDWGLIELLPDATGRYAGDYYGSYEAWGNLRYSGGSFEAYLMGYPTSGVYGSAEYAYGRGQRFCSSTWNPGMAAVTGSNVALQFYCKMSGGASGGPVLVKLGDGRWVIGGVNNTCWPSAYGCEILNTAYLDQRFLDFYGAVT